ncbi:hypothetical protein [Roseateles terrae]|uniref:DUF2059 domain-containing protein n=1 Tax=Roseateles terrae TaxID=431060 RepID=A0ABR6GUU6_9BURK|nr:hypothetical protein [Roseateles terrae]MBB3195878.1 hypothetical protein [Roseateles terrae]
MMIRVSLLQGFLTFVLGAATVAANAQSVAADFFAQGVLLGMQLSAKHGERKGTTSSGQAACIQALKPTAFHDAVNEAMTSVLAPQDLSAADQFFATPVGEKYAKYGLLQIYLAVGERAPESLPTFSDAEYRELETFAATPAGKRLILDKGMQSASAKSIYDRKIRELLDQCREK